MANLWEKQNTAEAKTKLEPNSRFKSARVAIEHKIGKRLPENEEEIFRNFDELVPKDVGGIDFAAKVKPGDEHMTLHKFSREGVKSLLEKELYGATLKEVEESFEKLLKANEKILKNRLSPDYESQMIKEHDDLLDALNELGNGSFGKALMELEIKIADWGQDNPGTEQLRNLARRLSVEVDKGKSVDKVDKWKLQFHFEFKKAHTPAEDNELFENASRGLESGNYKPALKAIDLEINLIQGNLKQLLSRDPKERAIYKEWLEKTYGDREKANLELAKLRNYREFLKDLISGIKKEEKPGNKRYEEQEKQSEQKPKKEKLEGEKLFQHQIENNSHPNAKGLQEDMILFIRSVDKGIGRLTDFQLLKEELSELLYRCGVEYVEGKETKIDGDDRKIIQPVLDFRKEMDNWNTLSETRIVDFRKRLVRYMGDEFGIEIQEPSEGEDYKKKAKATKIEETKNEFLNDKIKKVLSPGFKINENMFSYYEKWYAVKKHEMQSKWKQLDGTVSRQEFDKVRNEDDAWLKKYSLKKVIKQAEVEVYRYKA